MTEELIRQLIAAGLTKQQARSVLAEKITNLYMNDAGVKRSQLTFICRI